ncbi:MAG: hypothetical protein BGO43_01785 [Gammaproteobacteria bacterium 39-13]|nr:DUF2062 domain-containing protein [Gammaproteobacteria bacterium]OJV91814.1 MAG: hypothetical protein BGO43_01785 [Gammaproteobacteria bacterium 39-13]
MAKKFIKRLLPDPKKLHNNKYLKIFEPFFADPNFWHLNRHSVATAFSIGLFLSYMPFPGHMILAALLAIVLRANLPLSVSMVWVSNPFTIPPMYYAAYKLGAYLLSVPPEKFRIELSTHWLFHELKHYYEPLLLGCFISGAILAILGYVGIRLYWRLHVVHAWRKRAKMRQNKLNN